MREAFEEAADQKRRERERETAPRENEENREDLDASPLPSVISLELLRGKM